MGEFGLSGAYIGNSVYVIFLIGRPSRERV